MCGRIVSKIAACCRVRIVGQHSSMTDADVSNTHDMRGGDSHALLSNTV